jgi:N-acetylglutamate synthase-like GNAT family acetyltransferase
MQIKYLADKEQYVEIVSKWQYNQWGINYPDKTEDDYRKKVKNRLNKEMVPTTFIAIQDNEPAGIASLIKHDMDNNRHLTPWLADVYVKPDHRKEGIGSSLVKRVMEEAKNIGVNTLYLFTRKAKDFYLKLGWNVKETTKYHDDQVVIMYFDLK